MMDDEKLAGALREMLRIRLFEDRVRREFERGGQLAAVRSDVRKRKALDWLLERVEVVDEDGQPIDRAELEIRPPDESQDDSHDEDTNENETESDAE